MNCNQNNQADEIKFQIQQAYNHLKFDEIEICYNLALHDFIRISYPSQNNRPNASNLNIDFLTAQWIYQRMVDILDRAGGTSVVSYKENGINWTFAQSYIDPHLVSMIMPKARVPK